MALGNSNSGGNGVANVLSILYTWKFSRHVICTDFAVSIATVRAKILSHESLCVPYYLLTY